MKNTGVRHGILILIATAHMVTPCGEDNVVVRAGTRAPIVVLSTRTSRAMQNAVAHVLDEFKLVQFIGSVSTLKRPPDSLRKPILAVLMEQRLIPASDLGDVQYSDAFRVQVLFALQQYGFMPTTTPGTVGSGATPPGAVGGENIADGSITTSKLADKAVTSAKMGSQSASSGMVLSADGFGGATWLSPNTNFSLGGSGVLPVANGGTGLSAFGAANSFLAVNALGTALEYKSAIPDASLSANIAQLAGAQTFTGAKTFSVNLTFSGDAQMVAPRIENAAADPVAAAAANAGRLYYNTTSNSLRFSNGTSWLSPVTNVTASAPLASSGGATPDISLTGVIPAANLPVATTLANGVVRPDGTTITISGGVISASAGAGALNGDVTGPANANTIAAGVITGGKLASNISISTTGNIATTGAGTITSAGNINTAGALQTGGVTRISNTGAATFSTVSATGNINSSGGALQTAGVTRISNTGAATVNTLSVTAGGAAITGNSTVTGTLSSSGNFAVTGAGGTITAPGNINTTGGVFQTNGTTRIANTGAATFTTVTGSGNFNTTAGAFQTNGTTRIAATGAATFTTVTGSGNFNTTAGNFQTNGTTRISSAGAATFTTIGGTAITASGNFNTTAGAFQTNGTTRIANTGAATFTTISGTTVTGSGNFNTTAGAFQTNGTTRIAATGAATFTTINATGASTLTSIAASGNINTTAALQTGGVTRISNTGAGTFTTINATGASTLTSISASGNINTTGALQTNGTTRISTTGAGTFVGNSSVNGNLNVTGTLTKGAGSFKIDHPLDPANKFLSHSFVESPDMKNMYDGVIVLDDKGEGWVELPEYFQALNRDYRYLLTPIGGAAPMLNVAEEIRKNKFKIAGGSPGQKISWMVTGTRQDAYAEKNRIPNEELKTGEARGKYLNPEVFDMPESARIGLPLVAAE